MKSLTYICLSIALIGTFALMGQMTSTGDHVGKDLIEQTVSDFMQEDGKVHAVSSDSRKVACDHLALSGYECKDCTVTTAL
ncbi:hypothetical protein [Kordiimonas aquimaris]|uniref:hypothetical protein n=1 Tax=Kordiimonas aquimaris TaxID=707591 RepID=UPI0021CEA5F8|nr:hypothetical protein [Kordiimonas aquimaris]